MSRIGEKPIILPEKVTLNLSDSRLEISGPKGQLFLVVPKKIIATFNDRELLFQREDNSRRTKALHGLIRSQAQNAVIGVTASWSKTVQLVGVGFRAQTDGKKLTLMVGYSHPVNFIAPEGITFQVSGNDITISGCDKQLVGEVASRLRKIKPPESYKGKGIRYKNEVIHLKPGKAAKTIGTQVTAK